MAGYADIVLSIAALVSNTALQLRMLVDGAPGALEAPVRWVHNTELLDPSPYLREHELVMTNGLWNSGDGTATRFVGNVKRAGAAGIVFGLTAQTPRTPDELVTACSNEGIPLAEMGVAVPFTEISRAAAASLAEQRQRELIGMVRRSDALADTVSRGAGMAGVLAVLRRDHPELPVLVVDRMGRLLAGPQLGADDRQIVASALAQHPPPLEAELEGYGVATLFLCGALGGADAALVCGLPNRELDDEQRRALTQASRFLSLELARSQLVQAIEMRFAAELLDMISSGTSDERVVADRLEGFGIDPAGRMTVWAVASGAAEQEVSVDLAEAAREFFVTEAIPAVVATGSQDMVVIMPWRRAESDLEAVAGRLVAHAERWSARSRVVVGIGSVGDGVRSVRTALFEAREACRVLRRRLAGGRVVRFGALGTYHVLLGLQEAAALRRFATNVLGPIREHDADRDGRLEATVRAFLDHDGHWSETADALHIHVNTLRNRLARVTELTGRDVTRTEDRVDVFLALRASEAVGPD